MNVLQKAAVGLLDVKALLTPPTVEEFLDIWKKSKSPDDCTTDDEARARYTAFLDQFGESRARST